MKLYKVENFVYELTNSLFRLRGPVPSERALTQEAMITPTGKDIVDLLMRLGYTREQSGYLYQALVNHYVYDFGMKDLLHINENIKFWIGTHVAPAWKQAKEVPPPLLPPAVVYVVAVTAIILVVMVIAAPEFQKTYKWTPPCDLYLGVYEERLWWMAVAAVDKAQRAIYEVTIYQGGCIQAHTYHYIAPPVVTDRIHFWGSLDWRCWKAPWFRSYRTQHADCTYIGLLTNIGGELYRLQPQYTDPFLPVGPCIIEPSQICTAFSPCSS